MRRALAAVLGLVTLQCTLLAPSDAELRGSRPRVDAGTSDATALVDGGDAAIVESYTAISELANWSSFDLSSKSISALDFAGGSFDGRYIYLAPASGSFVARYDTQASFTAEQSWTLFDASSLDATASHFRGTAFDGRYLYLVPRGPQSEGSVVVRYDPQSDFTAKGSWATFDINLVNEDSEGFEGAVFDGRYLTFVPKSAASRKYNGIVTRYDTKGELTAKDSWTTFNTSASVSTANGFVGGVFDGRYVYLVPNDNGVLDGVVTRVDTQGAFGLEASWEFFRLEGVMPSLGGYFGGAFDGRYVYLVPSSSASSRVLRYDSQGTFQASWTVFDLASAELGGRFAGGAFDGRYVYLVPSAGAKAIRFDSRESFDRPSAWSGIDPKQVNAKAGSFVGAVFDGGAIYYVPKESSVVLRYQSRTPAAMPPLPEFRGSFF